MDLSETIASNSDQTDYQDFLPGPRVVTITEVRKGPSAEQPVEVLGDGLDRPWRPAKSMRRLLVAAWGKDADAYVGRRVKLYGDPDVKWAGKAVGGIRVEALSDIDGPLTVQLTVARGKRAPYTVQPLTEEAPAPAEPMITPDVWSRIQEAAQTEPENMAAWVSEQLGRHINHPQEITEAEGARLLAALQEGGGE